MSTVTCSGCKAAFLPNSRAAFPPQQLNASRECWLAFSLLIGMFYRAGSELFPYRQWAIDAYTLQHAKANTAGGKKAAALSLATLQLSLTAPTAVGHGPKLHQQMSGAGSLPEIFEPDELAAPQAITVKDLLNLPDEHEIIKLAHEWAKVARLRWDASLPSVNQWMIEHDYFMQHSSLLALGAS